MFCILSNLIIMKTTKFCNILQIIKITEKNDIIKTYGTLPLCLFFISFSIHYPCLVLNVSVYLFNTIFLVQIKCTICLLFSKIKQSFRREKLTINTLFFKYRKTAVLKVNKVSTKSDRSSCVNSDNVCGDNKTDVILFIYNIIMTMCLKSH